MKSLILSIRRLFAYVSVRSLEAELQGQIDVMGQVKDFDTLVIIAAARRITERNLAKARANYNALLPAGQRSTWRRSTT